MAKIAQLLAEIRALPPRTVAAVAAGHVVLLAGILWGGLHYVLLQVLLAAELVVLNVATMTFYRERGLRKHVWDTLKMIGGLAFVLIFVVVTYGVAAEGDSGNALAAGIRGLAGFRGAAAWWALFYVAIHIAIALWLALAAPDPRRAWAQSMLMEGGTTFVAMFLMVFVAIFVGAPLVAGLRIIGLAVDAGTVLATLMVALRFVLALVVATMPPHERDAIAADPYVD